LNALNPDVKARTTSGAQCFGPLALFHVVGQEVIEEGATSIVNKGEAEMVLCIYTELVSRYPHLRASHQIAVISPYSAQVRLWRLISQALPLCRACIPRAMLSHCGRLRQLLRAGALLANRRCLLHISIDKRQTFAPPHTTGYFSGHMQMTWEVLPRRSIC
jgi:hypothetical protein